MSYGLQNAYQGESIANDIMSIIMANKEGYDNAKTDEERQAFSQDADKARAFALENNIKLPAEFEAAESASYNDLMANENYAKSYQTFQNAMAQAPQALAQIESLQAQQGTPTELQNAYNGSVKADKYAPLDNFFRTTSPANPYYVPMMRKAMRDSGMKQDAIDQYMINNNVAGYADENWRESESNRLGDLAVVSMMSKDWAMASQALASLGKIDKTKAGAIAGMFPGNMQYWDLENQMAKENRVQKRTQENMKYQQELNQGNALFNDDLNWNATLRQYETFGTVPGARGGSGGGGKFNGSNIIGVRKGKDGEDIPVTEQEQKDAVQLASDFEDLDVLANVFLTELNEGKFDANLQPARFGHFADTEGSLQDFKEKFKEMQDALTKRKRLPLMQGQEGYLDDEDYQSAMLKLEIMLDMINKAIVNRASSEKVGNYDAGKAWKNGQSSRFVDPFEGESPQDYRKRLGVQ